MFTRLFSPSMAARWRSGPGRCGLTWWWRSPTWRSPCPAPSTSTSTSSSTSPSRGTASPRTWEASSPTLSPAVSPSSGLAVSPSGRPEHKKENLIPTFQKVKYFCYTMYFRTLEHGFNGIYLNFLLKLYFNSA